MRYVRKTFSTLFATVFAAVLALFLVVMIGAACSDKVTLRFETDGGTHLASVEGSAGGQYLRPNDPEKEGCYFEGWYLSPDCTGERQSLPDVMPAESMTFYAKYEPCPVLTLETGDTTFALAVKPGERLSERLKSLTPERTGLLFGGWYAGEEPLSADTVMPSGDLTLTARFKARYAVNVYLQAANDPSSYELNRSLGREGADWEGTEIAAEPPSVGHFLFEEEKSGRTMTLGAGENTLNLYFAREEVEITYVVCDMEGRETEQTVKTRYGAEFSLSGEPQTGEGYEFFGWSSARDGAEQAGYAAGAPVMAEKDITLYGCYAAVYGGARGGGRLAVAVYEREDGARRAVYTSADGEKTEGEFRGDGFRAGAYGGKLDGRGGFLPDDTGSYTGYGLNADGTNEAKYGKLELSFQEGSAVYTFGGEVLSGRYEYLYDEEAERYTGLYAFTPDGRGEGGFLFLLSEEGFLREGKEKGVYTLYGYPEDAFTPSDTLSLDGFGNAVRVSPSGTDAGVYADYGSAGEWQFRGGETFRFRLGSLLWSEGAGEVFDAEEGYLRYRGELAGRYTCEGGSLELDGYGINARCTEGGKTVTGRFCRDGVFVTLFGEEVRAVCGKDFLTFTLTGERFCRTSAEAGRYGGERGELFLDGAGGAVLTQGEARFAGVCLKDEDAGWRFLPDADGEGFRFRLTGGEYEVFSEELFGSYRAFYGPCLEFDGYGGGIYLPYIGEETAFTPVYYDGEYLEILVRSGDAARYAVFRTDAATRRAEWIQRTEAGSYRLLRDGAQTDEILFLCGDGSAKRADGVTEYLYDEGTGTVLIPSDGVSYLLAEKNGVRVYAPAGGAGSYAGAEGELILDGLGGAVWKRAEGDLSAEYWITGTAAEIAAEGKLFRFVLGGGYELHTYTGYAGELGALFLGGEDAFFRGESDLPGTVSEREGVYCFRHAGGEIFFRLYGAGYRLYDGAKDRTLTLPGGETLALDGCGLAVWSAGGQTYSGTTEETDGLIVFSCADLPGPSGRLGLLAADGGWTLLGDEFGSYAPADPYGETLTLLGGGRALLSGVRECGYEAVGETGNEFLLTDGGASFRVRIGRRDGEAFYERFDGSLSAAIGEYTCGDGPSLRIDGYNILYGEETLAPVHLAGGYLVARSGAGEILCFRLLAGSCEKVSAGKRFALLR